VQPGVLQMTDRRQRRVWTNNGAAKQVLRSAGSFPDARSGASPPYWERTHGATPLRKRAMPIRPTPRSGPASRTPKLPGNAGRRSRVAAVRRPGAAEFCAPLSPAALRRELAAPAPHRRPCGPEGGMRRWPPAWPPRRPRRTHRVGCHPLLAPSDQSGAGRVSRGRCRGTRDPPDGIPAGNGRSREERLGALWDTAQTSSRS
jgi:hypothetical protein